MRVVYVSGVQTALAVLEDKLFTKALTEAQWDTKAKGLVKAWILDLPFSAALVEPSKSHTLNARLLRSALDQLDICRATARHPSYKGGPIPGFRQAHAEITHVLEVGVHKSRRGGWPMVLLWEALTPGMRKFTVFCVARHSRAAPSLPLFPIEDITASCYSQWLMYHGLSTGGRHYLAEILDWGVTLGYVPTFVPGDITAKKMRQAMALTAELKNAGRPARGGDAPMPTHVLMAILNQLKATDSQTLLRRTMILWLWFTQLRPGHFTYHSPRDQHNLLRWHQILPTCRQNERFEDSGYTVLALAVGSKTHVAGVGCFTTAVSCRCDTSTEFLSSADWAAFCPVHTFFQYVASLPAQPPDFVFTTAAGKPYPRSTLAAELRQMIRTALPDMSNKLREAVVAAISSKSIRSAAGTAMADAGASIPTLMSALGHKDFTTTQTYYNKPSTDAAAARNDLLVRSMDQAAGQLAKSAQGN